MPRKDKNQRLGTASVPKLEGKTALEKLQQLSSMKYEHQAKWFLNVSFINNFLKSSQNQHYFPYPKKNITHLSLSRSRRSQSPPQ
jgi:hypothetical protein